MVPKDEEHVPPAIESLNYDDLEHLRALYAEFAEEDRRLAEEGMEEYTRGLLAEDTDSGFYLAPPSS